VAKLQNADRAVVELTKLTQYLLDIDHPQGGPKARFLARFGFAIDNPGALSKALVGHACEHDISASRNTAYGTIIEVEGKLDTPTGRRPVVRTVWSVDNGSDVPRLVTVVPIKSPLGGPHP